MLAVRSPLYPPENTGHWRPENPAALFEVPAGGEYPMQWRYCEQARKAPSVVRLLSASRDGKQDPISIGSRGRSFPVTGFGRHGYRVGGPPAAPSSHIHLRERKIFVPKKISASKKGRFLATRVLGVVGQVAFALHCRPKRLKSRCLSTDWLLCHRQG
jgi:hypothetical protein